MLDLNNLSNTRMAVLAPQNGVDKFQAILINSRTKYPRAVFGFDTREEANRFVEELMGV